MLARWLGLALIPTLATAAHAQAPGEYVPEDAPTPPSAAPVVVVDPCGGCINPMRNRFAIGLNVGGMSVSVDDDVNQTETKFRTGELSIRYRMTPHFELELLLSGGRQVLEDNSDGELAMGGGTLAARYRFRPDRQWNWWLMAGLGSTVIERVDSTKDERNNAQRGHVAFGIGLERRFNRFAIHAEFRGLAIGDRSDGMSGDTLTPTPPPTATPEPGGMTLPPPLPPNPSDPSDSRTGAHLSGGQFNIGASFYF